MNAGFRVHLDLSRATFLDREIEDAAEDGLMAIALEGEAYAKRSMTRGVSKPGEFPGVDTGTLKAGIHAAKGEHKLHKRLDSSAEYGPHLEWGTVRMAARPYMRPTARHMAKKAPVILAEMIRRRLR